MKTINRIVCALAIIATALLGTACMDNVSEEYDMSEGIVKLIPFTVSAQSEDATKVSVDGEGEYFFEDGDYLVITSEDGTLEGELKEITSGCGTNEASFKGTLKYTGSGDAPASTLKLTAKLVSNGDAIGTGTFVGGLAAKKTYAVQKFSTMVGKSTYGAKRFQLQQGTAFIQFNIAMEPAPVENDYEVILYNNDAPVATTTLHIKGGSTTFYGALPAGTLNHARVTLCGHEFKFAGTLEASLLYKVNREYIDDLNTPLTIEAITAGVVSINIPSDFYNESIYSPYPDFPRFSGITYTVSDKDGNVKEGPVFVSRATDISVEIGDKVSFLGDNSYYMFVDPRYYDETIDEKDRDKYYAPEYRPEAITSVSITCPQTSYVYGNVMSMVKSSGFADETSLTRSFALAGLFNGYEVGSNHIMLHPQRKLMLPATTLSEACYAGMFAKCVELTSIPDLPAKTLSNSCYAGMFGGCSSLTDVPDFDVDGWPLEAARFMFEDCTSLVNAPSLQSPGLDIVGPDCFNGMFKGCTALTLAPALPFTTIDEGCYCSMFENCTSLESAPELPATTLFPVCYENMFRGCTRLTSAPELPAPTLSEECYLQMFENCTSLNYIKCLATNVPFSSSTINWVKNVAPTGTFVEAEGMTDWELNSVNGIPPGWRDSKTVPLTLEATADGTITIRVPEAIHGDFNGIYYTINGGESIKTKGDDPIVYVTTEINVSAGDKVCLYGDNDTYCMEDSYGTRYNVNIQCNVDCYIYGNVMSLIRREGFASLVGFTAPYTFYGLFEENDHIVNHSSKKLLMPATVLSESCYANMFEYCTGLTVAPELPATQLATRCYNEMFMETGLTTAPELPSTIMAERCYDHMFAHCVSLTATPSLPATQLALGCYAAMFENTNLQEAPALPVTKLADRCYSKMFMKTPLSTAPALPATTLAEGCYNMMFESCPNLTSAPELPAPTLVSECYYRMFYGCINMEYIKCLAIDISASDCTYNWVKNVASSGTFYRSPDMMDWEINSNKGIPTGWTVIEE